MSSLEVRTRTYRPMLCFDITRTEVHVEDGKCEKSYIRVRNNISETENIFSSSGIFLSYCTRSRHEYPLAI